MKNKWSYKVNVILAKCKCIDDIFAKNSGDGVTRPSVLMLPGCGCTGTVGADRVGMQTVEVAA